MTRRGLLLLAFQRRDDDFAIKWNAFFARAEAYAEKYNHGPIDVKDPEASEHQMQLSSLWRKIENTRVWHRG